MEFKVGDKVYSRALGLGTVIDIEMNSTYYPVEVKFKSHSDYFTAEGRAWIEETGDEDIVPLTKLHEALYDK